MNITIMSAFLFFHDKMPALTLNFIIFTYNGLLLRKTFLFVYQSVNGPDNMAMGDAQKCSDKAR